jgi:dCMP deaminase
MTTENNLIKFNNFINTLNTRPNWDQYFMSIAILVSQRSSCERLKVGSVIVENNRIISTGYNGFLPGAEHKSIVIDNHEQATIHAEQNSICDAASRMVSVKNSSIYITHFPCLNCFKSIVASHIKKIFYNQDYKNNPLVERLSEENNIQIIRLI